MHTHDTTAGPQATPFIVRFQDSQQRLIISLFRDAARQRDAVRPGIVYKHVVREISRRVLRSMGESGADAYGHSLMVLHDFKAQAEDFACDALMDNGKVAAAKRISWKEARP